MTARTRATKPDHAVRAMHHDAGERPMITIWEVTRACQLVCQHCRADAQPIGHPDQLSTEQGQALLADIAGFGRPFPIVVLTGGDPFERADLPDLVAYGHSLGLHMAVSPSVTPKVTPDRLAQIHAAGANALSLSLDGASSATHDAWRGVTGVFEATLAAARAAVAEGLRLQVNSTVTQGNVHELPAILRTVMDLRAAMWSVFFLVPTGRGEALKPLVAAEAEDVMHWLHDVSDLIAIKTTEAPHFRRVAIQRARAAAASAEALAALKSERGPLYQQLTDATADLLAGREIQLRKPRPPIDVNSGRGFAFIDHVGDVYPSGFLPQHCGNVKDQGFRHIYRNDPLLQSLRRPQEFHGKCGVCEFNEVCGGSRSHAYAVTGDILASDPTCAYVPPAMAQPHQRPTHTIH